MTGQLILGLALSAFIGAVGYWRQALTVSGLAGAILVGTLIFGLGGWEWGLLLVTFFVSSSWLSHFRRADKEDVVVEFSKGSRRDLGQTLANGGLGAMLALAFARYPEPLLFAAFLGAMGTVTADTWATELGILSRLPPKLITTGQPVPPGTSGGVSRLGTWSAVAGALLIGTVSTALAQISSLASKGTWSLEAISYPLLAVVGGVAGSTLDSLLGATVQAIYICDHCGKETENPTHRCGRATRPVRGWSWLNNDVVNLSSSVLGSLVAVLLALVIWR